MGDNKGQILTDPSNNLFANIIYNKPIKLDNKLFSKIKFNIKEKKYRKKNVLPLVKSLKNDTTPFSTMCEFSDFIRIIEQVFFYYNDRISNDLGPRLISDSSLEDSTNKCLLLLLDKEKVSIIFKMTKAYDEIDHIYNDRIEIDVNNAFGKKVHTKFVIVNEEMSTDINKHQYALLFEVNTMLRKCMSELFMEYYMKA